MPINRNKTKKEEATLQSINELADLYYKNKNTIRGFYELNEKLGPSELRRKAITGSTFKAFHIETSKGGFGMSRYITSAIEKYIDKNPTNHIVRDEFVSELATVTKGRFSNWRPDDTGMPKLMKLYNLYANYWVAYNLSGDYKRKLSSIRKLNVPLDKYSLSFIRELYNASKTSFDDHLKGNLSMGVVIDMDHYNEINGFIVRLSADVTKLMGEEFCPIYLDVIQAAQNNLGWYTNNLKSK
jgi:hypothetical protein